MKMSDETTRAPIFSSLPIEDRCPFLQAAGGCCSATFSPRGAATHPGARFCRSEDYDLCPLFLAKVLRDTHAQRARRLSSPPSHF